MSLRRIGIPLLRTLSVLAILASYVSAGPPAPQGVWTLPVGQVRVAEAQTNPCGSGQWKLVLQVPDRIQNTWQTQVGSFTIPMGAQTVCAKATQTGGPKEQVFWLKSPNINSQGVYGNQQRSWGAGTWGPLPQAVDVWHDCSLCGWAGDAWAQGSLEVWIDAVPTAITEPAPLNQQQERRSDAGTSKDPVSTLTGAFLYDRTDMSIPGRGPTPSFSRSYSSGDTRSTTLGPGWTHTYARRIRRQTSSSGDVALVQPDGRSDVYTWSATSGTFTPPTGLATRLAWDPSTDTYTATQQDGSTWTFDGSGNLTRLTDRYGNASMLAYNGAGQLVTIADPAGRGSLTLAYDTCFAGRLCSVTDWSGRVVRYGYDARAA